MTYVNNHNIPVVNAFLRLYGETLQKKFADSDITINFLPLHDDENTYHDILARLNKQIYLSETEIGRLGLTNPEIFAAIAHELGHILYHTHPWGYDAETRADTLAAELGLGTQMISVIEKIIACRRFRHITSELVHRIQYLQHIA
ncbi:MAG: hypothetical protein NC328_03240 [Muribaculum sp.]|nr:hypothetical protein [Muribaculum sp.]